MNQKQNLKVFQFLQIKDLEINWTFVVPKTEKSLKTALDRKVFPKSHLMYNAKKR